MTVELTSREVFLLLQDNVRQLEANENSIKPECHKEITTKMRELLDLYDEAVAKVEAESEAQKRPEDFPRTASEVQAMNS